MLKRSFGALLATALLWCGLAAPAAALTPVRLRAIQAANPCRGIVLQLTFAGNGPTCYLRRRINGPAVIPGWSFTRASTGYAQTSAGTLVLFGSGVPRITDLGLLDELSATNLLTQSQTLDSWSQAQNSTVTANAIAAPDGTTTADLLTAIAVSGGHNVTSAGVTATASTAYTAYFYAKAGTSVNVGVQFLSTDANQGRAAFVLSGAGTANVLLGTSASATITALANGWYRCTLAATVSNTTQAPQLYVLNSSATFNYTGAGESAYFWGAEFKAGSSSTDSYIPTTSSAATRAADALTLTYSPNGSAATVTYGTNSTASPSPTSPINLGSSSGGAWVGNYVRKLVVTP